MLRSRKLKFCLVFCLALLLRVAVHAIETSEAYFDYTDYAAALSTYVSDDGLVNYKKLKASPEKLDSFLDAVGALDKNTYLTWPDEEKIAFLINAYNAYTLKVVINHYPIQSSFLSRLRFPSSSIRHIDGVWDKLKWNVMGSKIPLDSIEHGILRKQFNEPRIHFAVNCASMGCSVLLNGPYLGARLDKQLDAQAKRFVESERNFRFDPKTGSVQLSMIMKWYAKDFVQFAEQSDAFDYLNDKQRGVLNFLSPYLSQETQVQLKRKKISISFIDYDWSLNEQ
ncbi:DUF547 domain-containing protein [bacterium]|nr:DUF547 domain-containing protein [bacterium]